MSEADNEAGGGGAGEIGLALLLGGGVAEGIAAVDATLATVQGAAAQVLSGLSRVQAVGAAAASVPPVTRPVQPLGAPAEAPIAPSLQVLPAERLAPAPASPSAGPEQTAAYAPVSVPGGDWMTPVPLATQAPAPSLPAAPMPAADPAAAPAPNQIPGAAPITLASFAPPPPPPTAASPGQAGDGRTADAAEPQGPWGTAAPARTQSGWQSPAAPVAASGEGAAPRAQTPAVASAGRGAPTGGDVFLDGTRVGTWIADHLAREAGRPQTGATGFDPRLTPAWPGTLQGN